ncbi:hypothetical protein B0J12DRAFT_445206 [Macrophomina phaseolina]|uniref:Uncharacterized protein n=1 Tax=Macrophomina phaseolina TaxID=35725 RepID=A0ABQ8FTD1_9PEZI|nr:hypothetical protein B0J12DRAFT_445206 [Macrophomina phaseolina]
MATPTPPSRTTIETRLPPMTRTLVAASTATPPRYARATAAFARRCEQNQRLRHAASRRNGIPETSATRIGQLWARVMAEKASGSGSGAGHGRPTAASRARGTPGRYTRRNDGSDSGIGRSSSQTSRGARSTTSVSSRASSESGATAVASRAPSAKFSDQDFKAHVLSPPGIRIDDETKSVTPFYHFDSSPPPQGARAAYYQNLPGLSGATLWLESDDKFVEAVVREYASMGEYKLCEAEYASYAVESLLKREIRNPQLRETRHSMAERMIQLPTKPERMWHEPPVCLHRIQFSLSLLQR